MNKEPDMKRTTARQQGFTLIELIVVIVILGILAVTAAPKFMNLTSDANAYRRHAGLREEPTEPERFGR